MVKAHKQSSFGFLGRQAKKKLSSDNDIRIIIQGQNSQTGIGKTTLAIQLCRYIDSGWNAEDKAFVDVREYINAHLDNPKGSALLLDEIEAGADSRRFMSQENVDLSQAWATLRARNIATVCTLPSISMLDNRMLELADYWILVKNRGLAQPFEINVNDFAPSRTPQRKPLPGDEHISFVDLPDEDMDKKYLDKIKDEMLRSDTSGYIDMAEHKTEVENAKEAAVQDFRDDMIVDLYSEFDMSYRDLAQVDSVSLQYERIGEIIRENEANKHTEA